MKTTTESTKSKTPKSKKPAPAPEPDPEIAPGFPESLTDLLDNLGTLAASWQKLADIKDEDLPPCINRDLLLTSAEKINKAVAHTQAFTVAMEQCAAHYASAKDPKSMVAAGNAEIFLNFLDESIARVIPCFIDLLVHRAARTKNTDLLRLGINNAIGQGDNAVQFIRRYQELFPKADLLSDGTVGAGNFIDEYAREIYSRMDDLDALADEYPAHMRTAAVVMNAWPMLQFRDHDNRDRFNQIAARFDLGSACTPAPEESDVQSEARAAQSPEPQFLEEPLQPTPETIPESAPNTPPVSSFTMTLPRKGKIGRLPLSIREQLNLRIADGVETTPLLAWLNAQVETQEILRRDFASRPITPQNLSEWRQGGFQDWLRHQRTLDLARDLAEQADSLDKIMGAERYSERLSTIMAAQLAQIATPLMAESSDLKQRWIHTRQILKELARLRHSDYLSAKVKLTAQKHTDRSSNFDLSSLFPE